ncbi:MAG TPA: response regulator [Nitrospiraceae bacterium]|nr:response regulator [Nitrospiraceae bacterium]
MNPMNAIPLEVCVSLPVPPNPTALIVDDDPLLLEVVPSILRRTLPHLSVETCQSSRLATQKASHGHYDVAVIDLAMPELDGMEVLAHIRRTRPCTSFVLITGQKDISILDRAFSQGAFDFLGKPFNAQDLIGSVDTAIRVHRMRRRLDERRVYVSQLRETLERRWTKPPSLVGRVVIEQARSLMGASLAHIELAVKQTDQVIVRAERMLRRREDEVRQKARRRLYAAGCTSP